MLRITNSCIATAAMVVILATPGEAGAGSPSTTTSLSAPSKETPFAPELEIVTPPVMQRFRTKVEQRDSKRIATILSLTGIDRPVPRIRVVLASPGSPEAAALPPWVAGYARNHEGLIVLFPDRADTYPHDGFDELLEHELTHMFVAFASAGRPVPLWFNEGVATVASSDWSFEDRSRVTIDAVLGKRLTLDGLSEGFRGSHRTADRSYALSASFVRFIIERHGPGSISRILREVATGSGFESAFYRATGEPLSITFAQFRIDLRTWRRWIPILTSTALLWGLITLLALYAFRRRKRRDAKMLERWDEDEASSKGENSASVRAAIGDDESPENELVN